MTREPTQSAQTGSEPPSLRKLLVANRGEIARRVLGAARAMGIATVAVFSDPDREAPFVAEADEAVRLPGARAAVTYLNVEAVVAAARRSGADSVHPGYGFLAESAELAQACEHAGMVFVGPPAEAMAAMARKVEAKELAANAGLPVLASLTVPAADSGRAEPDPGALASQAEAVGFPILVKASAGGGGTGIRLVSQARELGEAVAVAAREAHAAFGDPTVFLERALGAPHHVEVQVLADTRGEVVHLLERECSIQRRHQKLIEETPSPSIGPELRAQMCEAAVTLAKAVGYVGAGTVEFLVEGNEFFFLEMNTRLQVEHRITEQVTGVDLVRAQLGIAAGGRLPVRQEEVGARGHAIEARLYAEDPAAGFLPTSGQVLCYDHEPVTGVLYDDAIAGGFSVSSYYDGLLSKVVAHGGTRAEAVARVASALRRLRLHGVVNNRDFLVAVLEDDDFVAGRTDTGFVEGHLELAGRRLGADIEDAHALAATFEILFRSHGSSPVAFAPVSWHNVASPSVPQRLVLGSEELDVALLPGPGEHGEQQVTIGGRGRRARLERPGEGVVDVELDGVLRRCTVDLHDEGHSRGGPDWCFVNSAAGQSDFRIKSPFGEAEAFASVGTASAPVPGNVTAVEVAVGDHVEEGELLVVLEAMKMEHRVLAPSTGVVAEVPVAAGDTVDAHQVLVVIEPAEDEASSA